MVQPKYNPEQALNKIKLMMNYNSSKTLTENKELFSIIDDIKLQNDDYLFDFVIAENNGFVIYMDNVFSKKHGFIGDLWENTWVFNEIIRENINKYSKIIGENIERDLDSVLMNINWTKEYVAECILNNSTLSEGFIINEQFWDKLKAGAAKVGGNILKGAKKFGSDVAQGVKSVGSKIGDIGKKLLMGPILGTLRWIRRNAYTAIGTVVDIVTAMLPATTGINKIVWIMIVILDFYELIAKNPDTADEERMQNPYMYLVIDIISALFSVAAGGLFKNSAKAAMAGTKKLPSQTSKLLNDLLGKLPELKNLISSIGNLLSRKLPKIKGIIDVVMRGVDNVIKGVENFIKQLFSKQGAAAVGTGLATAWFFKPRLLQLNDTGNDVKAVNEYISQYHNSVYSDIPSCKLSQDILYGVKNSGNEYTNFTEKAVKQIESCLSKKYSTIIKNVDGKISNEELAIYVNVQMDDRGVVSKIIPHSWREGANKVIGQVVGGASKFAQNKIEGGSTNTNL